MAEPLTPEELQQAVSQGLISGEAASQIMPEWQKSLKSGVETIGAVAPYATGVVPLVAGVAGGLLREPSPEAPPQTLVSGPSQLPQAAPAAAAPQPRAPIPGGANLGALDRQAANIGKAGAGIIQSAQRTTDAYGAATEQRKQATGELAVVEAQKAQAQAQSFDDQLGAAAAYEQRLQDIRGREDAAVGAAKKAHLEALEDAKYAGISPERRRELQAVAKNANASEAQKFLAQAELDKASKINADAYFGDDTGRKITAALAVALGGFGAALTGGPNLAFQKIQQAIQDNIAAQRDNFAKRRADAADAKAAIGDVRAGFDDERTQELSRYGIGLDIAKMRLGRIVAGLEGTEAGARAQDIMAQLDQESLKNEHDMDMAARGRFLDAETAKMGAMTNVAQLREGRAVRAAEAASAGNEAQAMAQNLAARGLAMRPGIQLSKEEIKKVSEIKAKGDELAGAMGRLIKMREEVDKNPLIVLDPGFRNRSETAYYEAQAAWKEGKNLGAWDAGTQEMLSKVFGKTPTGIGFVQDRYEEILDSTNRGLAKQLGAYGVEPLTRQLPPGAKPLE